MVTYVLFFVAGFLLSMLFMKPGTSPFFQDVVINNIKAGKKVAIVVDDMATMFEMIDDRIIIQRGTADFFSESGGTSVQSVDNSGNSEPGNTPPSV